MKENKMENILILCIYCAFRGLPDSSVGKESACNAGDLGLNPGLGRSLGEGNVCPLQYSGLTEKPGGLPSMGLQRIGYN